MDHVLVLWSDPPAPEMLAHVKSRLGHYHAGQSPNCFTGDTPVNLSNGCKDIWRVPYNGEVIDFMVAGEWFTVTPNHPILATNGTWMPAHLFNKGDYFIQAIGETPLIVDENENKRLPTFDELFRAFGKSATTRPAFAFDFYGDMADGDVDHITIADFLPDDFPPSPFEFGGNLHFSDTDTMPHTSPRTNTHRSEPSITSVDHVGFPLTFGHSSHADVVGKRSIPALNIIADEQILDRSAGATILLRESEFTDPFSVGVDNGIFRQIQAIVRNNTLLESAPISRSVRITQKRIRNFIGHVYTLQSNNGTYSITPAQIIVKNCRCDANVIVDLDQVDWPHKCYSRGSITRMGRARFLKLIHA
jgi:hypothetical protein